TEAAERAERERAGELKTALAAAQRNLSNSFILLAEIAWNGTGTAEVANDFLNQIPAAFRNWEWHYLKRKYQGSLFTLYGHTDWVTAVAVSGDGSRIVSGSFDKTVRVWDGRTGQALLHLQGHFDSVTSVAVSGDGSRIVSGSGDRTGRVWDGKTGGPRLVLKGHNQGGMRRARSTDAARIVNGDW